MLSSAARGRAIAAASTALTGGFLYWDATDERGGVGVTRAVAATSTAALIVMDYKLTLRGLPKDSKQFVDARDGVHERAAARLLTLCERNGGLYTKAGQFISTASGMPTPYQRQLSKLQDSARPLDWESVREVVAEELGRRAVEDMVPLNGDGMPPEEEAVEVAAAVSAPAEKSGARDVLQRLAMLASTTVGGLSGFGGDGGGGVFVSFDREPIAAASLAQVHRAVTAAGDEVAVKVQRPGLRRQFDVDLATMRFITNAVKLAFPAFDFSFLVPEFRHRLARELDFVWEGRSCERTGRALADDPRMVTPKVYWSLTTPRVLTMEYVRGVKVDDGPGLRAAGIDPTAAAEALADTFARMLACHGFVHGDPHPGNMLVRRQPKKRLRGGGRGGLGGEVGGGAAATTTATTTTTRRGRFRGGRGGEDVQIVLLDHGLYTELDESERVRMCRLWHAVAMRNPGNVRAASEAMGVPRSLQWVLPQLMARQTSQVLGNTPRAVATAAATARVDGLIRGGRPPMTMDQISEFGRALPREMMVVMRANALIRNIVRKLAVDVAAHEGRAGRDGDGRGILGLSLGGFVGGDVGRRMERRRQWAMAKYSCLGLILPDALRDGGEKGGGLAGVTWRQRARWRARTAKVWARMWTFRSMQYGVMLAIRTLPPGLSEPVVRRFTETLDRARGGLPAA